MEILSFKNGYAEPLCIALGFFDCVHIGHKKLIDAVISMVKKTGGKSCLATFKNNPDSYLGGNSNLIFTYDERLDILNNTSIDCILPIEFDEKFANTDRKSFLLYLTRKFKVGGIVCGYDYRFGAKAKGDSAYLSKFCNKNGIMCDIVSPILLKNQRVSSTNIRSEILKGDICKATEMLGHSYFIDGLVCHGRGVGKIYNFPTANLKISKDKLLPQVGTYATYTYVGEKQYKSVTNIGDKPTFGVSSITVETMLIDFNDTLYGENIRVEFVRKLRDIKKYDSPLELKKQIIQDCEWR